MVDWTLLGGTVLLILPPRTVSYVIAPSVRGDTEHRDSSVGRTFELVGEALVVVAFLLVAPVPTLVPAVTDLCGVDAVLVPALELARGAHEGRAVVRLVQPVSAVVLGVTPPPEWNALVGVGAEELTLTAV